MVLTGAYGGYTNEDVNNALIRAAINGNAGCVSLLLDWNADCDAEDMDGDTPLMLAACNNHIEVAQQLLRAGCGVNRVSDRQRTALHMASWVGNSKICKMLLQAGADLTIQEMYGDTALMLAAHRSPEVASLLAREGPQVVNMKNESGDSALGCATKSGHLQCVQDLVDAGADVNSMNRLGETALLFATYENHPNVAQLLLDCGADPNIATKSGLVPLHIACKKNLEELCQLLLEGGADPDFADTMGQRAMTYAVANGNTAIISKLIQAGATPRYQGPSLFHRRLVIMSPLYKALLDKRLDIARVLHRAGSCSQSELFEISQCEDLHSELEDTVKGKEVLGFIKEICSAPASLRLKCLQRIQSILGKARAKREKILSLQLPKPLISFLLFEDLDK
ncbi:ankyrin repeat domain-containing protein 50-like isoform X2 [Littorina saxatilis]